MKKDSLLPLFYSLGGAALLVVFAVTNLTLTSNQVTPKLLIIPIIIGLLSGYLLGSSKKKWLEKTRALNESAEDLKNNLEKVEAQKILTENLMRMVNSIPLPVYLKDSDHRYLLANGQYEALTGKSWEEIKGKTDFDIFAHPIAELFREQDQEVVAHKVGKTFEETVPLKDGILSFETFKFPLVNDDGHIYAVGGICTDITNLKKVEDSLNSQQERLDVVLRCISEAVIVTDCDRRILMFNRKAAELTEHNADLAHDSLLEQVYSPNDPHTGNDISFWREKDGKRVPVEYQETEVILRTRKGRAQPVLQKTMILLDRFGQNMGLLVLFRSVTQEKLSPLEILDSEARQTAQSHALRSDQASTDNPDQPVKIMVMDDDPLVRKTCALMLGTKGYETLHAQDGNEAIAIYRSLLNTPNPVNAVIMDLTVPGAMGGLEATSKILELDPDARIMVASGYSNDPVLANFEDYGFLARVEKPFAVNKLIQSVQNILEH